MGTPDFTAAFGVKIFQTTQNLLYFQPIKNRINVAEWVNHTTVRMASDVPEQKIIAGVLVKFKPTH